MLGSGGGVELGASSTGDCRTARGEARVQGSSWNTRWRQARARDLVPGAGGVRRSSGSHELGHHDMGTLQKQGKTERSFRAKEKEEGGRRKEETCKWLCVTKSRFMLQLGETEDL